MKATKRHAAAILAVLTLTGCAASVQPLPGLNGGVGYALDCTESADWNACYTKASEVCGVAGYQIIDRTSGTDYTYYGSGWSYSSPTRTMIIECKG